MVPAASWLFRVDDIAVFMVMAVIVAVGALTVLVDGWRTRRKERATAATPRRAA
jgi:hypothetical protein